MNRKDQTKRKNRKPDALHFAPAALCLCIALLTGALAGCGSTASSEGAGGSAQAASAASTVHEIDDEAVQNAWETFGQNGIDDATAEADSAEVEARIVANAYMLYHAEGIEKPYDALAYANFFPLEFRDWYEETFGGGIEDVCLGMEPTFARTGDYEIEELKEPEKLYSTGNINTYIEEVSGERSGALSEPWRNLRRMMEKWTVKHAFRVVYTTERTDDTPCEASFHVINVGTGWYIDLRDLQGPEVTDL